MQYRQSVAKSKWYLILTGLLSLAALALNLTMISRLTKQWGDDSDPTLLGMHINYESIRLITICLFIVLVILNLVQAVAFLKESKLLFIRHLVYLLFSLTAALLLILKGTDPKTWPLACFIYLVAVLISRIIALIRRRRKSDILLLILTIAIVFFGGCLVFLSRVPIDDPEMRVFGNVQQDMMSMFSLTLIFFVVDVQCVAAIVPIAFSSLRLDILKKIIRKTYATEILLGIVLLIVAISLILPAFEPGIDSFGDALWYCFAIVTTIGFGDIFATSLIGRILSVVLGLYGIIVVSLITSIIVNFYGELKKEEAEKEEGRREETRSEEGPNAGRWDRGDPQIRERERRDRERRERERIERERRRRE